MRKLLVLLALSLLVFPSRAQEISEETLLKAMHTISSHDLLEYVMIQCDEKYQAD